MGARCVLESVMEERIKSLRMEDITKRFPGVLASDHISLSVPLWVRTERERQRL